MALGFFSVATAKDSGCVFSSIFVVGGGKGIYYCDVDGNEGWGEMVGFEDEIYFGAGGGAGGEVVVEVRSGACFPSGGFPDAVGDVVMSF